MIRTFDQAYSFVLENKICTIFGSKNSPHPSLWDNVDLPDRKKGEKGWGEKVTAVWTWKNLLPATYPDEIFYGKVAGGDAVLMEMNYLRDTHYPAARQDASELNPIAQKTYRYVKTEPHYTGELRKRIMDEFDCTKSRFDTALKTLQVSLNIARSNHPDEKLDRWVNISEILPWVDE